MREESAAEAAACKLLGKSSATKVGSEDASFRAPASGRLDDAQGTSGGKLKVVNQASYEFTMKYVKLHNL